MIHFLALGTLFGLSAGFAPGPLLALVVSETLGHGVRAGLKVALAPLVTDVPIVVVSLLFLAKLSDFDAALGGISMVGGCAVCYLAYETLRTRPMPEDGWEIRSSSLHRGILVNALSPHPYLFWLSVGGPTVMKAQQQTTLAAVAFVASFYILLVGSKIFVALVTARSRAFLAGRAYVFIMRVLGVLLFAFAITLFCDGFELLGWRMNDLL
jgi:threonine/homoserine/homoserine lactone efflux protein